MRKLNDELKAELITLGYHAEEQGNKLKVKLGGLANPIYIEYDVCKSQFVVNTRDIINAVFLSTFMFLAFTNDSGWQQALLLSMVTFGLLSLILTELKSQALKQRVSLFNRGICN